MKGPAWNTGTKALYYPGAKQGYDSRRHSSQHPEIPGGEKMISERFLLRASVLSLVLCCAQYQPFDDQSLARAAQSEIDLTSAVVFAPADFSGPENKAVQMLIEEVERRTQIRWQRVAKAPTDGTTVISINRAGPKAPLVHEGYRLKAAGGAVSVTGDDARGILFGVGHLLRAMSMTKRRVTITGDLNISTAPKYPLRGHQLGFRPKTNSYDGWTAQMWEQYIRDLIVFGSNAIELIPPRSDDAADSPHFPLPQIDMMVAMSRICDEYGIDVWIWYPALDQDYSDP